MKIINCRKCNKKINELENPCETCGEPNNFFDCKCGLSRHDLNFDIHKCKK